MKVPTIAKIQSWIPKKYKHIIELVDQDSEVNEVVLLSGWSSVDGETIWVYGHHNLEEQTQKQMKDDLLSWLSYAEQTQ